MITRISEFTLKPGVREEATQVMTDLRERILDMNGMVSFLAILGEDRSGKVIVVAESRAVWDAQAAKAASIWAHFSPYIQSIPTQSTYEVVAHWSKGAKD